jgi:hypothetical protein
MDTKVRPAVTQTLGIESVTIDIDGISTTPAMAVLHLLFVEY